MNGFTTGTVGKGKATHAVFAHGERKGQTACGKAASATGDADAQVTCRSCENALPSWNGYHLAVIEQQQEVARRVAQAEADEETANDADVKVDSEWTRIEDGAQVVVTRVALSLIARVSFRHLDGSTGTLPLAWFLEAYRPVPAPVLRLLNTDTGRLVYVLGTSPSPNAPHLTTVWVRREDQPWVQGWSAAALMYPWHSLVAVDHLHRTNAEAARL